MIHNLFPASLVKVSQCEVYATSACMGLETGDMKHLGLLS